MSSLELIIGIEEWTITTKKGTNIVKYYGVDYETKNMKVVNPEDYYLCGFNIQFFNYEKGYVIKEPLYRKQ